MAAKKKAAAKEAPAKEKAATKTAAAKKAAGTKAPATKAPAKKAATKAATQKAPATKKAPAKKAPATKAPAKKAPAKKAPAKKAATKAPVTKAATKKAPAKRAHVTKAATREAATKKAPAKKAPATKAATKKVATKKAPAQMAPAQEAPAAQRAPAAKKAPASQQVATRQQAATVFTQRTAPPPPSDSGAGAVTHSPTERRLLAGGLLPLDAGAELSDGRHVDQVSARRYRHPALAAPVVRLVADAVAPGEDLTQELLGFEAPEVVGPLALQRRRALGFPGWALVHHPAKAKYALRVVKDLERAAKRAHTKPGEARDLVLECAKQLSEAFPAFLPTFYEEAGRAFIAAGNTTYAAQLFGKAREAEQSYGLERDLGRVAGVALEFALAGALTIKALSTYAADLAAEADPDVAYLHFRELCLRRARGGLPPWPAMQKDLKRLAERAGRDVPAEERAFLRALLRAGAALARAAGGFWTSYRAPLLALCAEDPSARGALLELFPAEGGNERFGWWLELLDETGALEALASAPDVELPPGTLPPGGAAAWFNGALAWARGYRTVAPALLFSLLRGAAPRLRAQGVALVFHRGRTRWDRGVDLDLLDLALELGLPVATPGADETPSFDLGTWASPPEEQRDERPRDPLHAAAQPRWRALLATAVGEAMGEAAFEEAARGKAGLRALREEWLARRLSELASGGLPDVREGLEQLVARTRAATFAEFPAYLPRLAAVDLAAALARSLRTGSLHELCWPALEAAVDELRAGPGEDYVFSGSFPRAIASDGLRALVVGPAGRELEHELRVPAGAQLTDLRFVGGELFVRYRTRDWKHLAYWSGAPDDAFEVGHGYGSPSVREGVVVLEDGASSWGESATAVRDRIAPSGQGNGLVTDGQTWWKYAWSPPHQEWRLLEFEPRSGKEGRASLPRWYEEFSEPGWKLDPSDCALHPSPPGSPLGLRDGLFGWRVRVWAEVPERVEAEGLDGRRLSGRYGGAEPRAALDLPGAVAPRALVAQGASAALFDPDGRYCAWRARERGWREQKLPNEAPYYLPWTFIHLLRPRDPAGSAALRAVSETTAAALLAAARADREAGGPARPRTLEAMAAELPAVRDPGLQMAVLRQVDLAAGLSDLLARHVAAADPAAQPAAEEGAPPSAAREPVVDSDVQGYVQDLTRGAFGWGYGGKVEAQWRAVGRFFATGARPADAARASDDDDDDDDERTGEVQDLDTLAGGGFTVATAATGTAAPTAITAPKAPQHAPPALPPSQVVWEDLLGRIGAVAYRAASPGRNDEERAGLLKLVEAWAEAPFAALPGRLRRVSLRWSAAPRLGFDWPKDEDGDAQALTTVAEWEGNRYFIRADGTTAQGPIEARVLEYAPDGAFRDLPGAEVEAREPLEPGCEQGWGTPAELRALAARVRERGPWTVSKEAAAALAEATGLSRAEAALLDLGLPRSGYDKNFLPKEVREALGLKVNEAAAAREALKEVEPLQRARALAGAFPAAAGRLAGEVAPEATAAALGSAWLAVRGRAVSIPEDLVLLVDKWLRGSARAYLNELLAPGSEAAFRRERPCTFDADGDLECGGGFGDEELIGAVQAIPLLFSLLPVGEPARAALPGFLERVRAAVADPGLLIGTGHPVNLYDGDQDARGARIDAFLTSLGGEPFQPPKAPPEVTGRDDGVVVAIKRSQPWNPLFVAWRPARWLARRDHPILPQLDAHQAEWRGSLTPFRAVERLFSADLDAFAARVRDTPVPAGGFEANPLLSSPELVARVRARAGLGAEAAALYLQLLTLSAPTSKEVQRLNGWSAKVYKAAADELAAKELVIVGKRARAGREHFLPGGWEDRSAPELPLETWKLPLYGQEPRAQQHGRATLLIPPVPLHLLFARAWERVEQGDAPAFTEVS
ncbi:MAG: hypothetical protein AB7T09_26290 [Planctomycetota bacterium]